MKGLFLKLSPFAPDPGVVSALYGLGALIVICDAGGCTGNVCGFDEPRWQKRPEPVFSAGLRDMDAILGRDDRLVARLADAAKQISAPFAAVVGTPVPAVIGTDLRGLQRLCEKAIGRPVLVFPTKGSSWYDRGVAMAQTTLLERFAAPAEKDAGEEKRLDIFGAVPMDLSLDYAAALKKFFTARGWEKVVLHGMGAGMEDVRTAGSAARALAVSPAGAAPADWLEKPFGTPWSAGVPILPAELAHQLERLRGSRVLVVHQQFFAHEVCSYLNSLGGGTDAVPASWFRTLPTPADPSPLHFSDEDDMEAALQDGGFQALVCDRLLFRTAGRWKGDCIDLPHFAVSGRDVRWSGEWVCCPDSENGEKPLRADMPDSGAVRFL